MESDIASEHSLIIIMTRISGLHLNTEIHYYVGGIIFWLQYSSDHYLYPAKCFCGLVDIPKIHLLLLLYLTRFSTEATVYHTKDNDLIWFSR